MTRANMLHSPVICAAVAPYATPFAGHAPDAGADTRPALLHAHAKEPMLQLQNSQQGKQLHPQSDRLACNMTSA